MARGGEAVGERVEEVLGGGTVGSAAGRGEDGVELGGLPHGARGRPWRRRHGTARLQPQRRNCARSVVSCDGAANLELDGSNFLGCFG